LQRNFQGYSTGAGASLYGFGVSSISSTDDNYGQSFKNIEEWRAALCAGHLPIERGLVLTAEDCRRRALVMGVMCDRRLDYAALSKKMGVDATRYFGAEIACLSDLEADGLLKRTSCGIEVLPPGSPLLRVIAMRFDDAPTPRVGRHCQTV
jgi:oxygen-independent coproporphyrinogen-3 oxidase